MTVFINCWLSVVATSQTIPPQVEKLFASGVQSLKDSKLDEAVKELERAVKLLPKQSSARLQLAKAYERTDHWFGVVDQYRALREIDPKNGEYAYQLGKAYDKLLEWSSRNIVRVNSGSARLYQTLGQNYLLQGKYELAMVEYQRSINADPKLTRRSTIKLSSSCGLIQK